MNPLRKTWRVTSRFLLEAFGVNVLNYRNNTLRQNPNLIRLLMEIRQQGKAYQSFEELLNVHRLSQSTQRLKGDIAEVGVYLGGSARLIAMNKGPRELHLFDSFEGMVKTSQFDLHKRGDFQDTSLESVQKYLASFDNIFFHRGWFPATTRGLEDKQFSFVHVDADLYQSTLDVLLFFYPRLVKGGVILSHDFTSLSCPGVSKAFNEYVSDKPECVIELGGTSQCLIVKS